MYLHMLGVALQFLARRIQPRPVWVRLEPVGIRGRRGRYRVPPLAARTIAALLTLRDQVIAPILAAVRSPRMGRKPAHWTRVDRDYERIRIDMQTLFNDLAIETPLAA